MSLLTLVRSSLLLLVLLVWNLRSVTAEIVYDNSSPTGGTNVYYANSAVLEFGDEVMLGGTNRVISQFLFEYYGDMASAHGDETARVRLYKNDGPPNGNNGTPGTLLYDTGNFPVGPGYITKKLTGLNIATPSVIIWTISFDGLSGQAGDRAGLILWPTPTVGGVVCDPSGGDCVTGSFDDFWYRTTASNWRLFSWGTQGPVANFAARIVAGSEPTTVNVRRERSRIIVEWTGLSILQVSDDADGPYIDLPNARNRYEANAVTAPMKFFRLRD